MSVTSIPRRDFLKGTGAVVVCFSLTGATRAFAQTDAEAAGMDAGSLDSWLAVAQNGTITVFSSKVDLGTGVETALAQIVAEELDVPFAKINMQVGDTARSIDQGITAGSRTIERAGPQLRQAAAAARQQLLKMAAPRLDASIEDLRVSDGVISVVSAPGRKLSYAQLLGGKQFHTEIVATGTGWDLKLAPDVHPKDPKDYKIVGTSVPRIDLPPKFTGEFTYTQDVRVPGMLHGRVVRPPTVVSKPDSVDESSISHIRGAKVVREGSFVGVVAPAEWAAIQAARALKVSWSTPTTKMPANADEVYAYLENTKSVRDQISLNRGNTESAISQASKTLEGTYRWPFQMHGMLAPSCAVADFQGNKITIWAGSQGVFETRTRVAALLKLPEKDVHIIYRESSGCYGRLGTDDAAEDAAVMSRAVGKPVKVQWMREDEHGWEPKGPAQVMKARAGMDAQGKIVAWQFEDHSFPWTEETRNPLVTSRQLGMKATSDGATNGAGNGGSVYTFDNQKIVAHVIPWVKPDPTPLRTSPLRAPGDLARAFASESFMDELAAEQKVDALQFRLRYATQNQRVTDVLTAAAKKANWMERPSPGRESKGNKLTGRGIAVTDRSNTIVSTVAEVEVDPSTGEITVKRVVVAHDCGLIINPNGLRNQIEGNVIQGTSRILMEEVSYDSSGIKSLDWSSYPILRFEQIPDIEIVLLDHPDKPALGGGEPSIGSIPAAITNAVFDATGVRFREVPLTPQRVLTALKA